MSEKILNHRPMLFIALSVVAGILVASVLIASSLWIAWIIISFISVILSIIFKKKKLILFFVFSLCAYLSFSFSYWIFEIEPVDADFKYVSGRVISIELYNDEETRYVLEDAAYDTTELKHNVLLISDNADKLEIGDMVVSFGTIKSLELDVYDSYSISYLRKGIRYEAVSKSITYIEKTPLSFFEKIKTKVYKNMDDNLLFDTKGIALSLLFGDKSHLSQHENLSIRNSGLSHIFAVSGLHVAFFVFLLFLIAKKLSLNPILAFIFIVGILLIYATLVGFTPSINRALIMTVIVLLSSLLFRRVDVISSLALASSIILIIRPLSLFDVGFLMSVSAVMEIVLFYKGIRKALINTNKLNNFTSSSFALSISANSLLLPVMLNTFNAFAIYFCLANLIILPLVSIAYSLLILSAVVTLALPFMGYLFSVASVPLVAIRSISSFISILPFATVKLQNMGIFAIFYFEVLLINSKLFMLSKEKKLRITVALIFICIILIVII